MPIKKLKIGVLAFIFLTTILSNSTTIAENGDIIVPDTYNGFLTDLGHYYFYGEIQNNNSFPVKNVVINITLRLKSGEQIFYTTEPSLKIILENRKSPFVLSITNKTLAKEISSFYPPTIISYEQETETVQTTLEIADHQPKPENNTVSVWIRLQETRYLTAFVTFYDKDYKILAVQGEFELELGGNYFAAVKFPFPEKAEEIRWYSITAFSFQPTYNTVKEEVRFAPFREENTIWTVFAILVTFSALVLIGTYVMVKIRNRKTRRRKRRST